MRNAWPKVSEQFQHYTKLNKIHCLYNFNSADTFDLKAYGMKNFILVSSFILFKLKLVGLNCVNQNRHLKFWELHVEIACILSRHSIDLTSTESLHDKICSLLLYYLDEDCDDFHVLTNCHQLIHIVTFMKRQGVPRAFWTFVYEVRDMAL
jgi:hypothetical protein